MDSDGEQEERSWESRTLSYENSKSSTEDEEVIQPEEDPEEEEPEEDPEEDEPEENPEGEEPEEDPEADDEQGSEEEPLEDQDSDGRTDEQESEEEGEPEGDQGGDAPQNEGERSDYSMPALEDMLGEPTPPRPVRRNYWTGPRTYMTARKRVRPFHGRQLAPRDEAERHYEQGESSRAPQRYSPYPSRVPMPRPLPYPHGAVPYQFQPPMPPHHFQPMHYPPPPAVNPWDVMRPGGPEDRAAREMHQARDIEAMMQRIDRLERENARLRMDADRMARELQERRNRDADFRG